ncbi:MAG: PAS domain S-box protein [Cytophagaceae bacterium]
MSNQIIKNNHLSAFVHFITESYADEFVSSLTTELKTSSLDFINKYDPDYLNNLDSIMKDAVLQQLRAMSQNLEESYLLVQILNAGNLQGINSNDLTLKDITKGFSLFKTTLNKFIPRFTQDPGQIIAIIEESEAYFCWLQNYILSELYNIYPQDLRTASELNKQLKQLQDYNQALIDNAIDRIVAFDRNMIITAWNKSMESTGIPKSEALGKYYYDIFPMYQGNDHWLEEVWKGNKVILKDQPARKFSGFYDAEIIPLFDEKGQVTGAFSFSRDVTERKYNQDKLKEQEKFIREIADGSPSLIYVYDFQLNKFVFGNKTLIEFFGVSETEFYERGTEIATSVIHPDDFPIIIERQKKYQNSTLEESHYIEYRNKNKNGEWRWLANTSRIFKKTVDGKIWQVLGIALDITDVRQTQLELNELNAELELRVEERSRKVLETEQRFKFLAESIPAISWSGSPEAKITYMSRKWEEYTGIPVEMCNDKYLEPIHPDERERVIQKMEESKTTGIPFSEEFRLEDRYGNYRWMLCQANCMRNESGDIVQWFGTFTDIHDHKIIEDELKLSRQRLEAIIEAIPGMAWTSLPDGTVNYLNKAWYEFTGTKSIEGWRWEDHIAPVDFDRTAARWVHSLQTGEFYEIEYRWKRHDGQLRWMLGRANPIRNSNGDIILWIGLASDIQAQKESEEKFKFLAETVPHFTWTAEKNGDVDYFNRQWLDYTGLTPEESYKNGWTKAIHPEDLENAAALWSNAIIKKQEVNAQFRFRNTIGEYRWFLVKGVPMKDEFGNVVKWFGTCTDIHQQILDNKELEYKNEELTKINNDLDNFIYTASHDLKAPVSNIEGLMYTLLETVNTDVAVSEEFNLVTNMMFQSVQRFKDTIQDLTDISKAQKSGNDECEKLEVNTIITDVQESIQKEIKESCAEIIINTNTCRYIYFSRKNFRSVVYNLLNNAIKYRSPERTLVINIKTYIVDDYSVFEISDNGLGINQEYQTRIFEMFKRLHDHVDGSGIGLYIVKRIIDNAGGKIEVESAEGLGTTFRVFLKTRNNKPFHLNYIT